jgi:hypothetical protein
MNTASQDRQLQNVPAHVTLEQLREQLSKSRFVLPLKATVFTQKGDGDKPRPIQ